MPNIKQSIQLWLAWLTVLASLISFILMSYAVSEFEELFKGFGAELPVFTHFVMNIHDHFYFLALPGVVGSLLIHNHKQIAGWWLVGFSGTMGIILLPLTIIAMYLPIFEMGELQ